MAQLMPMMWRLSLSKYSELLIMQYAQKPKAVATINAIMDEYDKLSENALDLLKQWDIDTATGFSLDIVGRRVGVSRTLSAAISKGFFGYRGVYNAEPWGAGVWFRRGDSAGVSIELTDADFRFLIKAKILKNFQNGTLDYALYALRQLFSEESNIQDNLDMTATIFLPLNALNLLQRYMITQMDILPRPMGVMYNYINASGKEFGFDGFYNSYGFNEGSFIDA